MKEELSPAIEALIKELEKQEIKVLETKKMINSLRQLIGEDPLFDITEATQIRSIKRNAFYGKPLATAVQELLEGKSEELSLQQIIDGLDMGTFDFKAVGWKENDRIRSLAISLSKNPKFHRLPNDDIGLASWYPDLRKKRQDKPDHKESVEEKENQETQSITEAENKSPKTDKSKKELPKTELKEEANTLNE